MTITVQTNVSIWQCNTPLCKQYSSVSFYTPSWLLLYSQELMLSLFCGLWQPSKFVNCHNHNRKPRNSAGYKGRVHISKFATVLPHRLTVKKCLVPPAEHTHLLLLHHHVDTFSKMKLRQILLVSTQCEFWDTTMHCCALNTKHYLL